MKVVINWLNEGRKKMIYIKEMSGKGYFGFDEVLGKVFFASRKYFAIDGIYDMKITKLRDVVDNNYATRETKRFALVKADTRKARLIAGGAEVREGIKNGYTIAMMFDVLNNSN